MLSLRMLSLRSRPAELTVRMCARAVLPAEINEAYNAFEEQRVQNATLLGQLTERDAALAAGQQERLKLEHQLAQMNEQVGRLGS